jgi:sugar (pentulose or hexulose) kinase
VALTSPLPDPRQTVKNRMSIAPWYEEGQWALIAGVGTSGSLLAELRNQTGLEFAEIDDLAKARASYPENALMSELTPARIAKISFIPGLLDEQKVSAVYDLILSNFSQRTRQLLKFAPAPERLVITGGHALLPELNRRKAEALGGIPTEARPKPEAAAYGAARLTA